MDVQSLSAADLDFAARLDRLLAWEPAADSAVVNTVSEIIADVRACGDEALLNYTARFDHHRVGAAADLVLSKERLTSALDSIDSEQRQALETAADRIRQYAENQALASWQYQEADGTVLGQQITPLDRVGLYVPGGKAAYPSSVLMNAVPAKVAGVGELIMVVPTPGGEINNLVLAAAAVAGVDRVFTVGGAQAIAALAYGT
ncbi:MAG: histidinol dehydrogenase, partial [Pseudomonadota bacterium]